MIRETMLHENSVKLFAYDFDQCVARLELSRTRDDEYPDYSLSLTFTGVTQFSGDMTDSRQVVHSFVHGRDERDGP